PITGKLTAPPYDPRFPNMNKTRMCWQNFVDYHRCVNKFGEEHKPCAWFQWVYKKICPNEWHERWQERVDDDAFAGRLK
ncbi:hypothetical protein BOX15_Mlig019271g1, partial [Macrostomum lignano]